MTRKTAATSRISPLIDAMIWGLGDLRDRLVAHGWWPATRTVAVDADGRHWAIRGGRASALARARTARAVVVSQRCLWGQVTLPRMPRHAVPAAMTEALHGHSPLPLDHVLYAWRAEPAADGWRAVWGIVPRSVVADVQRSHAIAEGAPTYLMREDGSASLVRDAAGRRWRRRQAWWDVAGLAALGAALASASLLALMPAALQRQGVVAAMQQLQTLDPQAAPIRQQLDALRTQARVVEDIRAGHDAGVPAASIIEALSAALPDDTVLDRIDINGRDIRISGLTPNATDLLSRVAGYGAFADAKAPNAAVRDPASNKERFTFELRWKGGGAS
ncbi:hypothetical protein Tther_01888 [Tepidimonas thermarum]|uniref:Uncharacterized protein n=1 Tax=Tepidimonas thermarum TaxID=335431 RepID=A0A554WYW0_9BURK|nr:PilN domain-containing protein [Tepidimonas thermarum]TSE28762.1 hypothetical protein Tther_01888 [Tepidimonas thermarum]